MAVVDAALTAASETAFIPTLWSDGVVDAAQYAGIIQKRVNLDLQDDLKMGNQLNIPRLPNLTTQSKAAGVANTINFEQPTESTQSLTVATHEYAAFLVESVVQVQANQDVRKRYQGKLGYALTRGREVTLAALFQNLSTNTIGSLNVEMTYDDYSVVWQKLAEAGVLEEDADPGDEYSLILSNAAYIALTKIDQFVNQLYQGAEKVEAVTRARVGQIFGLPVYRSNLLTVSGGGHRCAAFHKDCFALIVQEEVPVASQYMIRYLSDAVVAWNLYGTARVLFPPETPGGGSAADNRGVLVNTL